jgi:hypothetical protein
MPDRKTGVVEHVERLDADIKRLGFSKMHRFADLYVKVLNPGP